MSVVLSNLGRAIFTTRETEESTHLTDQSCGERPRREISRPGAMLNASPHMLIGSAQHV